MTALQRLFALKDGSNKTSIDYVVGNSSMAYLYSQYRSIEEQCERGSEKLAPYERTIEVDLPRTFPRSNFLNVHKDSFRQLLHAFVVYRPIAYVQGQNFLAAASLYYFSGRTPYLSFWLMVCLFDNLKHVFLLQIDDSFFEEDKLFHESAEEVVRVFVLCYEKKHEGRIVSDLVLLTLKNLVQWKLIGTLLLSCCGSDLRNTRHIIHFFLPYLYDTKAFQRKAAAVALSFLFCCFMEKKLDENLILLIQESNLSETGLLQVLRASKDTEKLLS